MMKNRFRKMLLGGGAAIWLTLVPLTVHAAPGAFTCTLHNEQCSPEATSTTKSFYNSGSAYCYKESTTGVVKCPQGCIIGDWDFGSTNYGHSWGAGSVTTESTCTAAGVKTITCSNYSGHTKTETVPMKPHTMTSFEVENKGSCTSSGNYEKHCSSCNGQRQTQTIPARGHVSWTSVSGVADGSYKRYYCDRGGTSEYDSCSDLLHTQYRGRVYIRKENLIGSFTDYALATDDYRDSGSAFTVGSYLTDAQFAYSTVDGVSYMQRPFNLTIGSSPKVWYVTEYRKKVQINYDRGQAP